METEIGECPSCTAICTGNDPCKTCGECGVKFWSCHRCGKQNSPQVDSVVLQDLGIDANERDDFLDANICLFCSQVADAALGTWGCNFCKYHVAHTKSRCLCGKGKPKRCLAGESQFNLQSMVMGSAKRSRRSRTAVASDDGEGCAEVVPFPSAIPCDDGLDAGSVAHTIEPVMDQCEFPSAIPCDDGLDAGSVAHTIEPVMDQCEEHSVPIRGHSKKYQSVSSAPHDKKVATNTSMRVVAPLSVTSNTSTTTSMVPANIVMSTMIDRRDECPFCTAICTGNDPCKTCGECGVKFWSCHRCGKQNSPQVDSVVLRDLGIDPNERDDFLDANICLFCSQVADAALGTWGCNFCKYHVAHTKSRCLVCGRGKPKRCLAGESQFNLQSMVMGSAKRSRRSRAAVASDDGEGCAEVVPFPSAIACDDGLDAGSVAHTIEPMMDHCGEDYVHIRGQSKKYQSVSSAPHDKKVATNTSMRVVAPLSVTSNTSTTTTILTAKSVTKTINDKCNSACGDHGPSTKSKTNTIRTNTVSMTTNNGNSRGSNIPSCVVRGVAVPPKVGTLPESLSLSVVPMVDSSHLFRADLALDLWRAFSQRGYVLLRGVLDRQKSIDARASILEHLDRLGLCTADGEAVPGTEEVKGWTIFKDGSDKGDTHVIVGEEDGADWEPQFTPLINHPSVEAVYHDDTFKRVIAMLSKGKSEEDGVTSAPKWFFPNYSWLRMKMPGELSLEHADIFFFRTKTTLFEPDSASNSHCKLCDVAFSLSAESVVSKSKGAADEEPVVECKECYDRFHEDCVLELLASTKATATAGSRVGVAKLKNALKTWYCPSCHPRPVLGTCWIPLGDIPVEHGVLAFQSKYPNQEEFLTKISTTASELPFTYRSTLKKAVPRPHWEGGPYRAGDMVVFDSRTIHSATKNTLSSVRTSLDLRWSILPLRSNLDPLNDQGTGYGKWMRRAHDIILPDTAETR